jgi:phage shock protein C
MKLRRSFDDRLIAGLCGGLADFLNIDSRKSRLAFILMTLFGGLSFFTYLIAWIVIPNEQKNEK